MRGSVRPHRVDDRCSILRGAEGDYAGRIFSGNRLSTVPDRRAAIDKNSGRRRGTGAGVGLGDGTGAGLGF